MRVRNWWRSSFSGVTHGVPAWRRNGRSMNSPIWRRPFTLVISTATGRNVLRSRSLERFGELRLRLRRGRRRRAVRRRLDRREADRGRLRRRRRPAAARGARGMAGPLPPPDPSPRPRPRRRRQGGQPERRAGDARPRVPRHRYVETRDADDELGSTHFLREVVGQLEADPGSPTCRRSRRRRSAPATPSTTASRSSTAARCSAATPPTRSSPAAPGCLAPPRARDDRRVPDLEPGRGPAVGLRGAEARLARAATCRSSARSASTRPRTSPTSTSSAAPGRSTRCA